MSFVILTTKTTVMDIHGKVLPIKSLVRFDHQKHPFCYWMLFVYMLLNAVFAGGSEFTINLYLFFIVISIEFVINLLGARLRRFGHSQIEELTANQAALDHKAIVKLIKHQIESGR